MQFAVRLDNLSVRYGRARALDGLTLSVPEGEVYGFLGRNGAGKTTTLRALMGIVKPSGGEIELLGSRMKRVPVSVKRRIGYVSQEQHFYPWMTATRLGQFVASFYPTWDAQEFERLLGVLDVPSNRRSVELSGGTRVKLALALALAPRPPLLLLDEPTSGLDPVARSEFNDLVSAMSAERGTTVFFSSHLVDEVESVATQVGIVQSGRMRAEGRVEDLRRRVRRIVRAEPDDLPAGLERVRKDVWQAADPLLWDEFAGRDGVSIEPLSLHEIFLAFARTDASEEAAA